MIYNRNKKERGSKLLSFIFKRRDKDGRKKRKKESKKENKKNNRT